MKATEHIARLLKPLSDRVRMMVARAVIDAVNDETAVQQMKIKLLAGEMSDRVERFQNYGFTSHPHTGMEAAAVFINGERSNPIIIAVGDRLYRMKTAQGEVAIYTDEGDYIHLQRGNKIHIECGGTITMNAATSITMQAPTIEMTADSIKATAPDITMTANTGITATTPILAVSGGISWGGVASGAGGGSAPAKFGSAGLTSEGDVRTASVSLNGHTHGCRDGGTGGPA